MYSTDLFMSQNDQQERVKWSLQQCIDGIKQPNDSRSDGKSLVEDGNVSINIITSPETLRRNANDFGNPLANRVSTLPSSDVERDNFHQRNVTTSDAAANTPRPRHPLYQEYESRLRSYSTWRQFQKFNVAALAEAGFFNIGVENGTTIRCFFCAVELVNPAYNDVPLFEHLNKSPNCGYLKQKLRTQDLIQLQERIQKETQNSLQTDGCAVRTSSTSVRKPASYSSSRHISRNPQFEAYSTRLASFARWPTGVKQRPEELAAAGFFSTGSEDVVRCFDCDGGMKNWEPDDEPWIEHARWFPKCQFVKRMKGQEFIDLVRRMTEDSDEEEDAVVHSTFQPDNPMADLPTLRNETNLQTDEVNESSVLETAAARSVLEMGYSRTVVAQAINSLITKGQTEYKAENIMEEIFEMESSGHLRNESEEDTDSRHGTGHINKINGSFLTLQQENERLRQSVQCVNCRKSQRSIFLLPCTHFCLCSTCAEKSSICPVCYKRIKEKIKTYLI
ncbi:hypothetical protein ACJMK2_029371 [Sinanodonta woodiana]|uniref:RING-type domain-containing protein n=1 Tax=Sinanodonta woodiana TaxID=1069815 RepID=A0ABD3XDZ3_SINWO